MKKITITTPIPYSRVEITNDRRFLHVFTSLEVKPFIYELPAGEWVVHKGKSNNKTIIIKNISVAKVIAVDFDSTCASHGWPYGVNCFSVPYAERVLKRLVEAGHRIVLWTMRSDFGKYSKKFPAGLSDAVKWFVERNIPLYGIQSNPTQGMWTTSPKAYANIYIDDAALGAPLCTYPDYGKPILDWKKAEKELESKGYLTPSDV